MLVVPAACRGANPGEGPTVVARGWAQTGRAASRGIATPTSSTWMAAGTHLATVGASVKENDRVIAAYGAGTNLSGPPQPSLPFHAAFGCV